MTSARRAVATVALCGVLVAIAGCGGSSDSSESEQGAPDVTSFDASDVSCTAAVTAPVEVTWNTENATAVFIAVDEMTPKEFGLSGSTTVLAPCDDESHEITITPESASGRGETETEIVSAD